MIRFLLARSARAALTLVAVSMVTYAMFFLLPQDPVSAMCPKNCNAERLDRVRHDLDLDGPTVDGYLGYMKGIFVGRELDSAQGGYCDAPCLGYSYVNNEPVSRTIGRALPVTVSIVIPAAVLWLTFGLGLGLTSAWRPGSALDRAAVTVSLAGASLPLYFVGGLLLLIFTYRLGIVPVPHYTPLWQNPVDWASGLVLAWLALAFLFAAIYARLSRSQMLETMSEDFIRTARAKGLPPRQVYGRHALRAAITPLITVLGLDIGAALGGTVITEVTFGLRGMGRTAVDAVHTSDLPTIMATVLIAAAFIVIANVVVDATYHLIDPRARAQ
ncbi:MAG TPA: ABC transporter permease [Nakamurella sp.]